jgi:pyrimidine operon attenuation protein/uracil phosphoribosyltransferase
MKKSNNVKLLSALEIHKNLKRMCREILRHSESSESLTFIGIRTRGLYLAQRLQGMIKESQDTEVPLGEMDISLYRDDLNTLIPEGKVDHTEIPFDINHKKIILFDDVIHTGRTVRAAVDHLIDLGRPKAIHLAVLIDRGGRELPISADYVGTKINLPQGGEVRVRLKEVDGRDEVVVRK